MRGTLLTESISENIKISRSEAMSKIFRDIVISMHKMQKSLALRLCVLFPLNMDFWACIFIRKLMTRSSFNIVMEFDISTELHRSSTGTDFYSGKNEIFYKMLRYC